VQNNWDNGLGSLRNAVAAANNGDTINFANPLNGGQIITLLNVIPINRSITIQGPGLGQGMVTISGNNATQLFFVNTGLNVTLNSLTLNSGVAQLGGAIGSLGNLTLNGDTFQNNRATGDGGGAISIAQGTNLTANGCAFLGNRGGAGGAIRSQGANNIILLGDTFTQNTGVSFGGAIYAFTLTGSGSLQVSSCTFEQNSLTGGGAFQLGGGAIYAQDYGLAVSSSTFDNNNAGASNMGGAIDFRTVVVGQSIGLTVDYSTFTANRASGGGAMMIVVGQGVAFWGSVTRSYFSWNNAFGDPNSGNAVGGALYAYLLSNIANFSVKNDTFYGNGSTNNGGGIGLYLAGANCIVSLTSLTVWQNQADNQGGGLYISLASGAPAPFVDNSIFATNYLNPQGSPANNGFDVFGSVQSLGYNLIGAREGSSGWVMQGASQDILGPAANPIDPGLNDPAYNGGPTLNLSLKPGSPAFRAGDPTLAGTTDQRGFIRQSGTISIGAYDPDARGIGP
jgi:predicted outer membrane repeat protein